MDEKPKTPAPAKTLALIDARDHFIGIALGKIMDDQLAKGKWQPEVAASHAVRFADAVMREKQTIAGPFAPGAQGQVFVPTVVPPAPPVQQAEPPVPGSTTPVPVPPAGNPIKSLQDQLAGVGATPLAEVS